MEHEVLEELKRVIEKKYGSLDNECGAYVNGKWLSIKAIVDLIEDVDYYY